VYAGTVTLQRRIVLALVLGALALAQWPLSASPVAAGSICDIKVSVQGAPPTDGPADFYKRWSVYLSGSGFPSAETLDVDVTADAVLVHEEGLVVAADGTVLRTLDFIGFLVDPSEQPVNFVVTVTDPADPTGCSDSIELVRLPDPPFDDIVLGPFLDEIIWLHEAGLLAGCEPTLFCGSNSVLRGHMAVLLVRSLALPATADDFFSDDDGHRYEWAINRLAAAGVTQGCGADAFCPNGFVTRAEMASFLVAAFELEPSAVDAFTDDDGSVHESAINALAASGITQGCSATAPDRFCPLKRVTREQLAAFLYRALT
jgi:hypothetical protein